MGTCITATCMHVLAHMFQVCLGMIGYIYICVRYVRVIVSVRAIKSHAHIDFTVSVHTIKGHAHIDFIVSVHAIKGHARIDFKSLPVMKRWNDAVVNSLTVQLNTEALSSTSTIHHSVISWPPDRPPSTHITAPIVATSCCSSASCTNLSILLFTSSCRNAAASSTYMCAYVHALLSWLLAGACCAACLCAMSACV